MAENKKREVSLDDLDAVSGGRIKLTGYGVLAGLIYFAKTNGHTKEELLELFDRSWNEDCEFKTRFTDATGDDYQKAMEFLDKNW